MSNAHLYVAVREAAAGTFDVLGELGTAATGAVVYLAREIASGELAVLKLEPGDDGAGGSQYFLDVASQLDASVPDVEMRCPRCRGKLRQWARFCTQCGLDVSGEAPASGEHASRAALREKVRAATADQYEFLGDIARSEGGGLVYFARDLADGKIVALRLQKDLNKKFAVGVTRTLKAVELEDAASARRADGVRPAVTIIQRPAPTSSARRSSISASSPVSVPKLIPAAGPNVDPSTAPTARPARRRSVRPAEIAAIVAVAVLLLLFLLRLR
jgi:hypothetical protein